MIDQFLYYNKFDEIKRRWLPVLIVSGVLVFSAYVGIKASPRLKMLVIGLIFAAAAIPVFLRWPPLSLVIVVAVWPLHPLHSGTGLSLASVVLVFAAGLWMLDRIVRRNNIQIASSSVTRPALLFIVVALLAFGLGQLSWFSFVGQAQIAVQIAGLSLFVLSIVALLLVADQIRDLKWLKMMVWIFLAIAAFDLARALFVGIIRNTRVGLAVGAMFWIWVVALGSSQIIINKDLGIRWRIALSVLVLLTIYIAAVARFEQKSSWMPALTALGAIIWLRFKKIRWAIILTGVIVVFMAIPQLLEAEDYSLTTRLEAWKIVIEIAKANPVLGLGFGNYYWYTPLFPILGWSVKFNSHNNYVDIIAQVGFVGLFVFFWILGEVGKLGWQLRDRFRSKSDFVEAYIYGAVGGLVGMVVAGMLADWLIPFYYNIGMQGFRTAVLGWLFLGGVVSLKYIYPENTDKDETNDY